MKRKKRFAECPFCHCNTIPVKEKRSEASRERTRQGVLKSHDSEFYRAAGKLGGRGRKKNKQKDGQNGRDKKESEPRLQQVSGITD